MKNNQNLFFSPEEKGRAFSDVLKEVQEYISSKYSTLMVEGGSEEVKQQVKRYITKYICDYRITVKGKTQEQLIDDLYTEMAEFSFLTKYIFGTGIEEIDINSWRDIEIQYNDGRCEKLEEHFESPEHAVNVIRRMLHVSGMVLDNASPAVLGHLSKNIRIAVLKTPLVDEDVGIAASIRIVNPQSLKKENFVDGGTATGEMLDFLAECLRYGISICVAGATSSGKTTLAGWLLTTIPDGKRIFTIENGSRELALVREKDGKVTNSVIHTLTRYSENEKQNIDQDMLLDMALRFNPEIICVGEMRSSEAYTAQESARTGHTVLTTIHSNSCESTYSRMRTLCKRKYDMDDEVLMDLVTEAFPIVVFTKQLENRKRKLMEIMECEITADGKRKFNPLYRYEITENRMEGDRFIINGTHKKVCGISESLKKRFLENGMPKDVLEKADEKKRNPWLHEVWYDVPNQELNGMTANDALHLAYNSIIRELAEKGDCVFVGRCADYILEQAKIDHISLFIAAPFEWRVKRKMEQLSIDEKSATAMVRKKDKDRKAYYDYYTGRNWGRPYEYDLCINSSRLGIEATAEKLVEMIRELEK